MVTNSSRSLPHSGGSIARGDIHSGMYAGTLGYQAICIFPTGSNLDIDWEQRGHYRELKFCTSLIKICPWTWDKKPLFNCTPGEKHDFKSLIPSNGIINNLRS